MKGFEAMEEGVSERLSVSIDDADVARFGALSGDDNPIHGDEAAARAAGYERPVAHGMLLGAYVSQLIGTRLPGHGAVLHSVTLEFVRPVFAGDALLFTGTVKHRSEATRVVVVALEVRRGDEVVARGRAQVGCP